ncbi:MAG: translation initiation factor IF-2 [Rhodospirillaceae bacterium]|nr:MAG: translation initiation factor IF-2 [Rhodospirillaceae bacterium]
MDRRERYRDTQEAMRLVQDALQVRLHTALPGIIQKFDPVAMTCEVQAAITFNVMKGQGFTPVELPPFVDCPVHFPSGGGFTLTFPIKPGDECLVIFAERCIDAWWESGGIQNQQEIRFHDLSDGFVIPKVWSQPNVIPAISTSTTQLRSDDGQTFVEVTPVNVRAHAPQDVIVEAGRDLSATVGNNATVKVGRDLSATVGNDVTIDAVNTITLRSKVINLFASDELNFGDDTGVDKLNLTAKSQIKMTAPLITEN